MENKQQVLHRFEDLLQMVDSIYELMPDIQSFHKNKLSVSEKTKEFKELLIIEKKRMEKLERKNQLSDYEDKYYIHGVIEADAQFLAPYNTNNFKELCSSLYDARSELSYYYRQIKPYIINKEASCKF